MTTEPLYYTVGGMNEALVTMCKKLLEFGVKREMNGFQASTASACYELPGPVTIAVTDPTARQVLIPERKWNKILPVAESLWMLMGSNDLDDLPGHFVKSIYNFSDDGHTWRGGYGSRIRGFTGISNQYYRSINDPKINEQELYADKSFIRIDQLEYVVETLRNEPTSRQALITIHDPAKDSQLDLKTKDIPCTRSLHFMIVDGKLNLYVWMRSNDAVFGFSAVNLYNFTLMQQYVAKLLHVPVGVYYHIADNFHYYENKRDLVEQLASIDLGIAIEYDQGLHNDYDDYIPSLGYLDDTAMEIYEIEEQLWNLEQNGHELYQLTTVLQYIQATFTDPFFKGWAYAFPLAMKSLKKETKQWLIENGESKNKMIAQFF